MKGGAPRAELQTLSLGRRLVCSYVEDPSKCVVLVGQGSAVSSGVPGAAASFSLVSLPATK